MFCFWSFLYFKTKSNYEHQKSPAKGNILAKYWPVGIIKEPQGIRGEVFIHLFAGQFDWLGDHEELFCLTPTQMIASGLEPESRTQRDWLDLNDVTVLPIASFRVHQKKNFSGLVVSTPAIADRNAAEKFQRSLIVIPEAWLKTESKSDFFLGEIIGFEVVTKSDLVLGVIEGLGTNGVQDLIEVRTSAGLFDVPLVEPLLIEVQFELKRVVMELPPGLLDDVIEEV